MGHSKIFQIASKPIYEDEYNCPADFYENSDDFADYIGEEVSDEEERKECIDHLADTIDDVFTHEGDGVFVYKGEEALRKFKQAWLAEIQHLTDNLNEDNLLKNQNQYRLSAATEQTHLHSYYRIMIEAWNGCAAPIADLFEFTESQMKAGDHIYVGAVIDYHY